jgi:hypothetical protein
MPKITIEKDLYERTKQVAEEAGYSSIEEFVTHLLERVVTPPGTDDQDATVMDRLKGLGYIS